MAIPPRTVEQALAFLRSRPTVNSPPLAVPARQASGHVLAEDVFAPASLPRFDNAAMDGYAIRSLDLDCQGFAILSVVSTIAAGQIVGQSLRRGEAMRIMTGAQLPPGSDRVVMQEDCQIQGDKVQVRARLVGKPHIRRIGEDVSHGSMVIAAGAHLGAGHLALLTGLGIQSVQVYRKPRVALLSTGDELVDSTEGLLDGKIYDSNGPMLALMIENFGAEVSELGIIQDDRQSTRSTLVDAAGTHDLIISSGGAFGGFADFIAGAVREAGTLDFWKLNMRPGKPVGFGQIGMCPILLLPGNPVAAAVGFALLGRAALAPLKSAAEDERPILRLPTLTPFTKPMGQFQGIMARFHKDRAGCIDGVEALPVQGSASLTALSAAQAIIILASDQTDVAAGDLVEVGPLW